MTTCEKPPASNTQMASCVLSVIPPGVIYNQRTHTTTTESREGGLKRERERERERESEREVTENACVHKR